MPPKSDESQTADSDFVEAGNFFREMLKSASDLVSSREGGILFPHGIGRIAIELKAGSVEAKLEIDGSPSKAESKSIDVDLLATKNVKIDFRPNGEGVLKFGTKSFPCLGSTKHQYPKDLTVKGIIGDDKFAVWHSVEFGVDMPFAVKIWGQKGIFIHEGEDNIQDNGGESAGCIHLASGNAEEFYKWVDGPTRIQISYPW